MPLLKRIFVIHTTADEDDAETDANFQIQVVTPGGDFIQTFPEPITGSDHNQRERGRTDEYEFNVEGKGVDTQDSVFEIRMRMISTTDGWLPTRIWVLGETRENQIIVVAAHPEWQGGWFDRGDDAAGPEEHVISS
jgi:hypothetical protein